MTRIAAGLVLMLVLVLGCATPRREPTWNAEEAQEFLRSTFDTLVDRHLEAGYEDPTLLASDALLERRIIVIMATFNERTVKDAIARLLYLDSQDPVAPIHLVLSTQGGWPDATFALVDAIEMVRAPVDVWGVGGVYSGGAMVLAAGTGRRVASRNAIISVHVNLGEPVDHNARLQTERVEAYWRRHARLPASWYPMAGEQTYYLSPSEALAYGIIDEILEDGRSAPWIDAAPTGRGADERSDDGPR